VYELTRSQLTNMKRNRQTSHTAVANPGIFKKQSDYIASYSTQRHSVSTVLHILIRDSKDYLTPCTYPQVGRANTAGRGC